MISVVFGLSIQFYANHLKSKVKHENQRVQLRHLQPSHETNNIGLHGMYEAQRNSDQSHFERFLSVKKKNCGL